MDFLITFINGLSVGGMYAMIALGYTMVYGIAKMLTFSSFSDQHNYDFEKMTFLAKPIGGQL